MAQKLRQLARKALDRAEVLKSQEKSRKSPNIELSEPPVDGIFIFFSCCFYLNICCCFFMLYLNPKLFDRS